MACMHECGYALTHDAAMLMRPRATTCARANAGLRLQAGETQHLATLAEHAVTTCVTHKGDAAWCTELRDPGTGTTPLQQLPMPQGEQCCNMHTVIEQLIIRVELFCVLYTLCCCLCSGQHVSTKSFLA